MNPAHEKMKQYYQAHKEHLLSLAKETYRQKREQRLEQFKAYYQKTKEQRKEAYRQKKLDKTNAAAVVSN
jgi:alpha-D-ribose 1-methylphosphonate 5-triphosphate diphosphatase PhnM